MSDMYPESWTHIYELGGTYEKGTDKIFGKCSS